MLSARLKQYYGRLRVGDHVIEQGCCSRN